jgi:hypothetical protein
MLPIPDGDPGSSACLPTLRKGRWTYLEVFSLLALAALVTVLNSLKPLHMDDGTLQTHAAHIANHPLDPYGFEILWHQRMSPAHQQLAPPVALYWWALAIRLFGDQPVLWKLWFLAFNLVLVFSLHALCRRFVRRLEMPLVWMAVLSPAILPSLNLMLDIPALSLGLLALTVFLQASDRASWALAGLAGLIAGLAMQTKYTAFVVPAVLLLHGILFQRIRLGLLASGLAVLVFAGVETWLALRQGESMFLHNLQKHEGHLLARWLRLSGPLLTLTGGVGPAIMLLGLVALRLPRRIVLGAGAIVLLGYALLAIVPGSYTTLLRNASTEKARLTLNNVVFGALGWLLCGTLAAVAWRLCRSSWRRPSIDWFLVLWLALEVASYFTLSPFPAVRRVLGVLMVATLLIGRLAARTCRTRNGPGLAHGVVFAGIVLGLVFQAVDWQEAQSQKQAAEEAMRRIRELGGGPIGWYTGEWGFEFYAERAGLKQALPGLSQLCQGDWLVVPDDRLCYQNRIALDGAPVEVVEQLAIHDGLPLRTVSCYYGGRVPLEHCDGPRVSVTLYRVLADFIPVKAMRPSSEAQVSWNVGSPAAHTSPQWPWPSAAHQRPR